MTTTVSIIIISYNKPEVLKNTLNSIYEKIFNIEFEVIVVDNASQENNVEMVKNNFPQVKLVKNNENFGFAKACNQGAEIAKGEYLLFVNSDIVLLDNPISGMLGLYSREKNVGLVSAQLINEDGSLQPSFYGFPSLVKRLFELVGLKKYLLFINALLKKENNFSQEISAGKGAFLMIPKKLFFAANKFDENYFMYIEDIDLSFQTKKLGCKNMLFFSKSIIHLGWNVEKVEDGFGFYNRNKGLIYFYKKNYSRSKYYTFIYMNKIFLNLQYFIKSKFNLLSEETKKSYQIVLSLYSAAK